MSKQAFLTIAHHASGELVEKKSRFIAFAALAADEKEAQDFLAEIKAAHREARHHVYAYIVGPGGQIQRSCDDGEPAGTGGRPVLEAIKNAGLQNTVIMVVRYFGGILLGTGGLSRAYGKSAALALQAAGIMENLPGRKLLLTFDYTLLGVMENWLALRGFEADKNFSEIIAFSCLIPENLLEESIGELEAVSQGKVRMMDLGGGYWIKRPLK